jgi:hypothetical protein
LPNYPQGDPHPVDFLYAVGYGPNNSFTTNGSKSLKLWANFSIYESLTKFPENAYKCRQIDIELI